MRTAELGQLTHGTNSAHSLESDLLRTPYLHRILWPQTNRVDHQDSASAKESKVGRSRQGVRKTIVAAGSNWVAGGQEETASQDPGTACGHPQIIEKTMEL